MQISLKETNVLHNLQLVSQFFLKVDFVLN